MKWDEKPYFSFDYAMKQQFSEKIYKLSLQGGMTCPNRDGTLGRRGCIFCSEGGSGDFAADAYLPIKEQIEEQKNLRKGKVTGNHFLAYFQSYTNTYAPVSYLRPLFLEALACEEVVGLSIATRPDCLGEDVLELLKELQQIKPIYVELGLQTIHESSAQFIRRGYPLSTFESAVTQLNALGIPIIVHTILGLPNEHNKEILATIDYLNHQPISGIKLQLLHILKGTDLGRLYTEQPFFTYSLEEYANLIVTCVEHLSPNIVIHRLTGDGPKPLLIAPLWSSNKRQVLNTIHKTFKERDTWQGRLFT